jgi:tetratricopeptide (TPR) repeat protein
MLRTAIPLAAAVTLLTPPALARPTVAIAPLSSTSSPEYQWIGAALAGALSLRVHDEAELNGMTLRQVNSAMRHDNIAPSSLSQDDIAARLGKQLGVDLIVVGTFAATWPDIEIMVDVVDPWSGKAISNHIISGDLDQLIELEARLARALARDFGLTGKAGGSFGSVPGMFGTKNLRAWRATTLALEIINWQSLSPRSAGPAVPLRLPPAALKTANDHLMAATKHDANYGEAWATLGVVLALQGDTEAAWRSFGKATALGQGHNPTAVLGAGFVRMREGRHDDAADIYLKALKHNPGFLHALGYLAELYNHLGNHREAKAAFETYHETAPKSPWVLAQLGYTKSKLKDYVGAIADTIAAVDMLPESPSLLIQLASRYIDANKLAGAEDALRHALELFPNEPRVYVRLGYVYLRQDKLELSIPISEKGLALAEFDNRRRDRGYAHLNLARAYGRQGDLDTAFDHLAKAREQGIGSFSEVKNDPQLHELRADSRYKMGGY